MGNKLLLSSFAFSLVFILGVYSDNIRHYDGYSVIRLTPKTESQLKFLHDLEENNLELDFWKPPSALDRFVDVMVPPHLNTTLRKVFRKKNFVHQVLIQDVEKVVEEERIAQRKAPRVNNWTAYGTLAQILSWLTSTASANPTIAQIENIGKSYQNNDLRLIKIGENVAANTKPIIFIDSGIHAREWIGPAFTTWLAKELINGYNNGSSAIKPLVQKFDWYILPVVNPDGYAYTQTDRMWRKTRKPDGSCIGTDPNRNFGYQWGGTGASTNPCSETYRGASAFSEPETKALSDYITGKKSRTKAYFAVHSYGQYWLYPWGYTSAVTADDAALKRIGTVAINALRAPYSTAYTIGTSTNVLYAAAGGADDWAYGSAGIKYSHTVELRDRGTYGFTLPASQIQPCSIETTLGFLAFARELATELGI